MPVVQGIEFGAVYLDGGGEAVHPRYLCASPKDGQDIVAYIRLATGRWYWMTPLDFLATMRHGADPEPTPPAPAPHEASMDVPTSISSPVMEG